MGRKALLTLQSVLCILLVVLLSVSAVQIYREGLARKAEKPLEWIYTRELAGERFGKIAPLFWMAIGITAAGLMLDVRDEGAEKPGKDVRLNRDLAVRMVSRASEAMQAEQRKQKNLTLTGWIAFGLCMLPVLLYCCNGAHFPNGDLEPVFRALLLHVLPWTILGLGCLTAAELGREKSMLRETDAARAQREREKEEGIQPQPENSKKTGFRPVRTVRILLLCAAVLLILAGTLNGGARDVLYKAAKICTECVGLG